MKSLPYFCRGEVIRGFGRGSKELGIPTANFPDSVVDNLPADIGTGIYYGWACVGNGDVYKMVMSIGWNPYYKNTKKSMETHVIHTFKEDFYGEILSVVMVGYIRPERSYDSLGMTTLSHSYIHAYTQTAIFARSQRSDLSQASRFDLYYFSLTPTLLSTLYAHYSDITLVFVHFAHTLCVFSDGFSASLSSLFLVEALITAISNDIEEAKAKLELPEHLKLRKDNFFTSVPSSSSAAPSTAASTSQTIMNGH
ncbi:Riboflavin kinase [Larimichthys crocea]|uniref:Uncharacterized protein n=1 Tax=Larimichthys crocea TaxID=215358 RepID=A0ACD3Q812_LARCR|nr:Riboflavin kinase [Larimichthys crocea]